MASKPTVGGSSGTWGTELNAFIDVSHETDGTLKTAQVESAFTKGFTVANNFDFLPGHTMTTINTFETLDLNSIIGSNRSLVLLRVSSDTGEVEYSAKRFAEDGADAAYTNTAGYPQGVGHCRFQATGDVAYLVALADSSGKVSHLSSSTSAVFVIDIIAYIQEN